MNVHHERAVHLQALERYREALVECLKAVAEAPAEANYQALLGELLWHLGQRDEALAAACRAVDLDPTDAHQFYRLSYMLAQLRLYEGATEANGEALALAPDNAEYWAFAAELGRCQRAWEDTRAAALRALAIDPNHLLALQCLGQALLALQRVDDSVDAYQRALAVRPEDGMTHQLLGWALLARDDHAGALTHFHESLRQQPQGREAKAGMVETLKRRHPLYGPVLRVLTASNLTFLPAAFSLRLFRLGVPAVAGGAGLCAALHSAAPRLAVALPLGLLLVALAFVAAEPLFLMALAHDRLGRHLVTPTERSFARQRLGGLAVLLLLLALGWLTGSATWHALALPYGMCTATTFNVRDCSPRWPRLIAAVAAIGGWGICTVVALALLRRMADSGVAGVASALTAGAVALLVALAPWILSELLADYHPAPDA